MKTNFVLLLVLATAALAQSPGAFTATGNMTTPRSLYSATLLPNGKVLIAGGSQPGSCCLASAELYDPSAGTFTATGNMTAARAGHSATLLPDGKVFITGGLTSGLNLADAELYDASTGEFTAIADMVTGAGDASGIMLMNGKVLITHPSYGIGPATAQVYDPVTGAFSATGNQLASGGWPQQATLLADGRVYFSCCLPEQLYDPASGTFSFTGARTRVYADEFGTALLPSGKVLLSGGFSDPNDTVTDEAELYDPATGASSATAEMTTPRSGHTATLLGDGTILIAGGATSGRQNAESASAEVYDPGTAAFSRSSEMQVPRAHHTATLLNDGSVLITGGSRLVYSGSAERYTPAVPVPAPALFSVSGYGPGQGAIWHAQTGQIASADNPAIAGEGLSMYTTNLIHGGVIPPQVSIGGRLAEILYFGASGHPGYDQVNFRLPIGVGPGRAVPVRLTYLSRPSNAVLIGVQ